MHMPESLRMVVVLSVICAVSGLVLSSVKTATAPRIEMQVLSYVQGPTLRQVFPDIDNDPIADRKQFTIPGSEDSITVFPAMRDGKLAAVAFETSGKGYGGDIGVMVGFNLDNDSLAGIGVTTMKETPGVGTRVAQDAYTGQFLGHDAHNVALSSQGGDISAVSGATYSSVGTVAAVQSASAIYAELKPELEKAW